MYMAIPKLRDLIFVEQWLKFLETHIMAPETRLRGSPQSETVLQRQL